MRIEIAKPRKKQKLIAIYHPAYCYHMLTKPKIRIKQVSKFYYSRSTLRHTKATCNYHT